MAMKDAAEFAQLIARLADGARVYITPPDPELRAELLALDVGLDQEPGEFVVSLEPLDLTRVHRRAHAVLAPITAKPAELLRRAAAAGFVLDADFEAAGEWVDWVLLTRLDSPLQSRIESLEDATADLEADRQRLREIVKQTRRELRVVKESPAWRAIGWYRKWLHRRRQKKSLVFSLYDKLTGALVTSAAPTQIIAEPELPDAMSPALAPATRFTAGAVSAQDWQRIFRGLAAHSAAAATSGGPPRISIITPLWNTKPAWLAEAAVSIFDQTSPNWEWCIVDDRSTDTSFDAVLEAIRSASARVRFTRLNQNGGISKASNEGLQLATGDFVCFLDHDDLLHPEAIELCLERLEQGCEAVYTDSNKASENGVCDEPFYKPDWSPEYFRSVMYVGHLLCVRREEALALRGFDSRYDGVQDFEFFLRYSERHPRIEHIARILYHWRRVPGSTATSANAKQNISQLQQRAVAAHLERVGLNAAAVRAVRPHRVSVQPNPRTHAPRVSIIIPTKDSPDVLGKCLDSIFRRSTYKNLQVICADNETTDEKALTFMRRPGVERLLCPGKFNFSRVNNVSSQFADGEYLVFLNNDIEVMTPDWIEQMLFHAEQPDAGAVGAMLLYPDRTVQHCGIGLGFRGTADHILRRADSASDGYSGSLAHAHECSAVTAACLMISKSLFQRIGRFDAHYFTAYQDVDLCLRLQAAGLRNVYTPRAVLMHHESYTRKDYYDLVDRNLLLDSWEEIIQSGDPFYNVNFDRRHTDYRVDPHADTGEVASRVTLWSPGKQRRGARSAASPV